MEEVILTSDFLIHYFAYQLPYPIVRHRQAVAIMERILNGEYKAHISEVVLIRVGKFLQKASRHVLDPEPAPDLIEPVPDMPGRYTLKVLRESVRQYLLELLQNPNILHPNKAFWDDLLFEYMQDEEMDLEELYLQ